MENAPVPSVTLANALENNKDDRYKVIADRLSHLSKCLPYNSKNKIFIADDKLFHYLLLAIPFSKCSIELIINAALFKHQENEKIYTNIFYAINSIFSLEMSFKKTKTTEHGGEITPSGVGGMIGGNAIRTNIMSRQDTTGTSVAGTVMSRKSRMDNSLGMGDQRKSTVGGTLGNSQMVSKAVSIAQSRNSSRHSKFNIPTNLGQSDNMTLKNDNQSQSSRLDKQGRRIGGSKVTKYIVSSKNYCIEIQKEIDSIQMVAFNYLQKCCFMMLHHQEKLLQNEDFGVEKINPLKSVKLLLTNDPKNGMNYKAIEFLITIQKYNFFKITTESIKEMLEAYKEINPNIKLEHFAGIFNVVKEDQKIREVKVKKEKKAAESESQKNSNDSYDEDEEDDDYGYDESGSASKNSSTKDKTIKDLFELFIIEQPINIITKTSLVGKLQFKDSKQMSIFFSFLIDPFFYDLTDDFKDKYDGFMLMNIKLPKSMKKQMTELRPKSNIYNKQGNEKKNTNNTKYTNKSDDEKRFCMIRAFLTFMMLCNEDNFCELTELNPNIIQYFYQELSSHLKYANFVGNIKIVIKLIEFFIMKDPCTSLQYLIGYDILTFLQTQIEDSYVRNFLITLLDPSDYYLQISDENKILLWKYSRISNIFYKMIRGMTFFPDVSEVEGYFKSKITTNNYEIKTLQNDANYVNDFNFINMMLKYFDPWGYEPTDLSKEILYEKQEHVLDLDIDRIHQVIENAPQDQINMKTFGDNTKSSKDDISSVEGFENMPENMGFLDMKNLGLERRESKVNIMDLQNLNSETRRGSDSKKELVVLSKRKLSLDKKHWPPNSKRDIKIEVPDGSKTGRVASRGSVMVNLSKTDLARRGTVGMFKRTGTEKITFGQANKNAGENLDPFDEDEEKEANNEEMDDYDARFINHVSCLYLFRQLDAKKQIEKKNDPTLIIPTKVVPASKEKTKMDPSPRNAIQRRNSNILSGGMATNKPSFGKKTEKPFTKMNDDIGETDSENQQDRKLSGRRSPSMASKQNSEVNRRLSANLRESAQKLKRSTMKEIKPEVVGLKSDYSRQMNLIKQQFAGAGQPGQRKSLNIPGKPALQNNVSSSLGRTKPAESNNLPSINTNKMQSKINIEPSGFEIKTPSYLAKADTKLMKKITNTQKNSGKANDLTGGNPLERLKKQGSLFQPKLSGLKKKLTRKDSEFDDDTESNNYFNKKSEILLDIYYQDILLFDFRQKIIYYDFYIILQIFYYISYLRQSANRQRLPSLGDKGSGKGIYNMGDSTNLRIFEISLLKMVNHSQKINDTRKKNAMTDRPKSNKVNQMEESAKNFEMSNIEFLKGIIYQNSKAYAGNNQSLGTLKHLEQQNPQDSDSNFAKPNVIDNSRRGSSLEQKSEIKKIEENKTDKNQTFFSATYNILPDVIDGLPIVMPSYQLYPSNLRNDNQQRVKAIFGKQFENKEWVKNEKFNSFIGHTMYEIVRGACLEPNKYLNRLKLNKETFWESIFESGNNNNFELLLMTFLIKSSRDIEGINSNQTSCYYCGKIIITILQTIIKTQDLIQYKKRCADCFLNNIYLFEMKIVNVFETLQAKNYEVNCDNELKLQTYTIRNPIGSKNLIFCELIVYFLKVIISMGDNIYIDWENLNTIFHIFTIWVFEKRNNTIISSLYLQLIETLIDNSITKGLENILIKINLVSVMNDVLAEFNGDIQHARRMNLEHAYHLIRSICHLIITKIFDCKEGKKQTFASLQHNMLRMKSWGIIVNKISKANEKSATDQIFKDYLAFYFSEERLSHSNKQDSAKTSSSGHSNNDDTHEINDHMKHTPDDGSRKKAQKEKDVKYILKNQNTLNKLSLKVLEKLDSPDVINKKMMKNSANMSLHLDIDSNESF